MAQQYDNRQGRGKSADISTDNAQLEKSRMPEQNRDAVRKGLHPDSTKGAELLNKGIKDRSGDFGRDAVADPVRQARPQMMAMISTVFPELSASQSPQRDAFIKAFENPALVRSYLINPQETAGYLIQRFPDMKDTLLKNMPFQKIGSHLEVNKDSGIYERIKQEVSIGLKPSDSFIRREMDKLLSSALPASVGGSMGMETKAYELVRNRIETNDQFNKAAEKIELRMTKLMTSPQAKQDLKEAQGLAAMGPLRPGAAAQPASPSVPTTNGARVQGELKPAPGNPAVQASKAADGVPTTTGAPVQGPLKPVAPAAPSQPAITVTGTAPAGPAIVPGVAGVALGAAGVNVSPPSISVPGIAASTAIAGVGLTATTPGVEAKIPVPDAPKAPVVEAKPKAATTPTPSAVPTTDGTKVEGELKQVSPANPTPAAKPAATPDPTPTPAPNAVTEKLTQENKQLTETNAKLTETLAKNNAAMEAIIKKLEQAEAKTTSAETKQKESAAQTEALVKRLEESERRAARAELRTEVNEQLRDKGQRVVGSKELDDAVKAATKPDQKELPSADEVVAKITANRIEVRKQTGQAINASMNTLPNDANIQQTREWVDSNMKLYNGLDAEGQKAFQNYLKNVKKFDVDKETVNAATFFNQQLAESVARELKGAAKSETFRPPVTGPVSVAPAPITVTTPDMVKVAEVLRSIDDLKDVKPLVQAHPDVRALKDKLPKDGWIFKEDGVFQKSIDARLEGRNAEAEAFLIRSLISSGEIKTKEQREKIRQALDADPSQKAAIGDFYKKTFGADITADVRAANKATIEANKTAIEKAAQAEEELKKAQEKIKKLKEEASDLIE